MAREYTVEEIRERVTNDQRWTERAIMALYRRQTEDERLGQHTNELNGAGFNKADAEILSSFAKQLQWGGHLTPRQFDVARRRVAKYAGQLARIAQATAAGDAAVEARVMGQAA